MMELYVRPLLHFYQNLSFNLALLSFHTNTYIIDYISLTYVSGMSTAYIELKNTYKRVG